MSDFIVRQIQYLQRVPRLNHHPLRKREGGEGGRGREEEGGEGGRERGGGREGGRGGVRE